MYNLIRWPLQRNIASYDNAATHISGGVFRVLILLFIDCGVFVACCSPFREQCFCVCQLFWCLSCSLVKTTITDVLIWNLFVLTLSMWEIYFCSGYSQQLLHYGRLQKTHYIGGSPGCASSRTGPILQMNLSKIVFCHKLCQTAGGCHGDSNGGQIARQGEMLVDPNTLSSDIQ